MLAARLLQITFIGHIIKARFQVYVSWATCAASNGTEEDILNEIGFVSRHSRLFETFVCLTKLNVP